MTKNDQRGDRGGRSLIDGQTRRGNCGVGFVARLDGVPLHEMVEHGVRVLVNLEHRGAVGGDKTTGDGAGLLLQVPDRFLRADAGSRHRAARRRRVRRRHGLSAARRRRAARCAALIERHARSKGVRVLGWRDVPVSADTWASSRAPRCRRSASSSSGAATSTADAFERKLYVIRRLAEKEAAGWGEAVRATSTWPASRPDGGLQGHADRHAVAAVLPGPERPGFRRAPSPSCTSATAPTRFPPGSSPSPSACWPTTARSTPCAATSTACAPARRCWHRTLFGDDLREAPPDHRGGRQRLGDARQRARAAVLGGALAAPRP